MADLNAIVEQLSGLTILEAAELVKQLETKWGVSAAAAPVVVAGAAGGAAAAPAEEKTGSRRTTLAADSLACTGNRIISRFKGSLCL